MGLFSESDRDFTRCPSTNVSLLVEVPTFDSVNSSSNEATELSKSGSSGIIVTAEKIRSLTAWTCLEDGGDSNSESKSELCSLQTLFGELQQHKAPTFVKKDFKHDFIRLSAILAGLYQMRNFGLLNSSRNMCFLKKIFTYQVAWKLLC